MAEANEKQIGGNHYKQYGNLQPWDVITAWNLGYLDGTALKYIARWRDKGGLDDIRKAIHFLEKFIEVESSKQASADSKKINVGITDAGYVVGGVPLRGYQMILGDQNNATK